MIRIILKNLWNNRKQNGWIFAEIALITALSWFMVDYLVVTLYSTHFCIPAGEFEKNHLCVGKFAIVRGKSEYENYVTAQERQGILAVKDKLASLPEVQSVCLTPDYLGEEIILDWRHLALPEDSTKTIYIGQKFYYPNERYFETQGLRAIEGSPDAETLSREIPENGIIVTRSVAQMLFGTDQVVKKQVVMVEYMASPETYMDEESEGHYVIAGVVEDVKGAPTERYPYTVFFPRPYPYVEPDVQMPDPNCSVLLRLKPDVDAEAFVTKLQPVLATDFRSGVCWLGTLQTYNQHLEGTLKYSSYGDFSQLASVPLVLFAINIVLGTLGTFWLQIRKRKEDIGIMRAFGASKRRIFATLLGEGAILTLLASLLGDFIWLQFNVSHNLLSDGLVYGASGRETDWVTLFWPHFLIISLIVFLLLLVIVSIGIALPAWNVCRRKIVEALRDE